MPKYSLTPADTDGAELRSDTYGEGTADLVTYGARNHGLTSEYDLAMRLEKLRCVALELITQLDEEGYSIDPLHLQVIDVEVEVAIKKRLTL